VDQVKLVLDQKSNVKDICALLDLKSNIDDVNKAFEEMHEEVENKMVKTEFDSAMSH
jgi:hypothetical protein